MKTALYFHTTNLKTPNMSNAESYLARAIEALNAGALTTFEASFIELIKDYNKKQLRELSAKQFTLLRSIAAGRNAK